MLADVSRQRQEMVLETLKALLPPSFLREAQKRGVWDTDPENPVWLIRENT